MTYLLQNCVFHCQVAGRHQHTSTRPPLVYNACPIDHLIDPYSGLISPDHAYDAKGTDWDWVRIQLCQQISTDIHSFMCIYNICVYLYIYIYITAEYMPR